MVRRARTRQVPRSARPDRRPTSMRSVRSRTRSLIRASSRFFRRDEAISATEYAMLVAFVAIVVVGVLTVFGPQISAWLSSRTGSITTV